MSAKPTILTNLWASSGLQAVTTPTSGKQLAGWAPGEKPPNGFLNWFFNAVTLWVAFLNDAPAFVPTTTNANGLSATGNGTGSGASFTGGSTNGLGVVGIGSGTGAGVRGTGGATGGGVVGIGGATSGTGVAGTGTAAGATGIVGTGGPTNGVGVIGNGIGTGAGIVGNGPNGSVGLVGQSGASGAGIQGISAPGSGAAGVIGFGFGGSFTGVTHGVLGQGGNGLNTSGNGVIGTGGTLGGVGGSFSPGSTTAPVNGAVNLNPVTATPTTPGNGDLWIENVAGVWHFKVRMNGITSTIV